MTFASAFNIARTGLQLQELNLSIKSQNLSSQGVDAFKRQYLVAQDLPYQDLAMVGSQTSSTGTIDNTGIQIGSGVKPMAVYRSWSQGDMVNTGEPYDIAIQGEGFYQISRPDGSIAYTRMATFTISPTGQLTTPAGHPLIPNITIPNNAIAVEINNDGEVAVELSDGTINIIGQLQLATFINNNGLKSIGDNLFIETPASGTPNLGAPNSDNRGTIMQGWKELSNVNAVEEITDLIKIQRCYEQITKVINTGDSMMEASNRMARA
jgi:flagellar basal-body rod protein FlgG